MSLELSLFGSVQATLDGRPLDSFRTRKVQALLIWLIVEQSPGKNQREKLMTLLWPGLPQESAQTNLRQIIYQLRKAVPPAQSEAGLDPVPLLQADRQSVHINPAFPCQADVPTFEALLRQAWEHDHQDLLMCADCLCWLQEAIALYRGDFLADFYLSDSNEFEEWAATTRANLRRQALDALETVAEILTYQKDYRQARTIVERQLEIDNLRESAYRQLMTLLALCGQRSEALGVYETCRRLLADELGMAPTARTTALYEQIRAGEVSREVMPFVGLRGYELKEEIGSGTFGTVHRAVQSSIGREVAIKVIRPEYANDAEFIRRFDVEAQTIARLEHPHIVPLYDYWREPDRAFLVMRFFRGGSLQSALQGEPWPLERVVKMVEQIALALEAAHRQGIVHCDLKPANVLLDDAHNTYLSDFGIAVDRVHAARSRTPTSSTDGREYVSPEQRRHESPTPQTDVYSLGLVLYETLSGEKPFGQISSTGPGKESFATGLPSLSAKMPEMRAEVDAVILRATATNPEERYPDVLALATAFVRAVRGEAGADIFSTVTPAGDQDAANPYKGLRPFRERDAGDFFGREALVERILARLSTSRFLAVIGPSGSGKSSVVFAGLIPALRAEALPGSQKWFVAQMTPGTHPLEELEQALLPIAVNPPPSLVEPMLKDRRGLLHAIRRILPEGNGTLLLIIDQFEELYTLTSDEKQRDRFIDSLLAAIIEPGSPLRVVVTLRADFYDRPLGYLPLGELLQQHTEVALPLSLDELEQAVRGPAARRGVRLETRLMAAIVSDIRDQPGALPLLQYSLTELFEARRDSTMTRQAYQAMGGIAGALGSRAESLYGLLNDQEQAVARQLFLRLVTLGEGVSADGLAAPDTRRRAHHSELVFLGEGGQLGTGKNGEQNDGAGRGQTVLDAVLDHFGRHRLLTFDRDPLTRGAVVEVAHEALLTAWPRLHGWIETSRDDLRQQRRLSRWAAEWEDTGRNPGLLLRSARLDQLSGWSAQTDLALSGGERAFLEASVLARQEREAAEETRRRRELETAKHLAETERQRAEEQSQAAQRLQRRAVYLVGALLGALLLAVVAVTFQQSANRNAALAMANASLAITREAEAEESARLAASRQAEAEAEANLRATAEAVAIQERMSAEQQQAIAEQQQAFAEQQREIAEQQVRLTTSRELALAALTTLDSDPELSIMLAVQALQVAHTREAENMLHQALSVSRVERTLFGHELEVSGLAFSPDGKLLASGSVDTVVRIWEVDSGRELHALTGFENMVYGLDFDPAGQRLAASSFDGTVRIWDVGTGVEQMVLVMPAQDGARPWLDDVEFSPDGQFLAVGGYDQTIVWDLETEQPWLVLPQGSDDVTFSPNGRLLAFKILKSDAWVVTVWDLETGQEVVSLATSMVSGLSFSPDGKLLATESPSPGASKIWHVDLDSPETFGQELARLGGSSSGSTASTITFLPDNRRVLYLGNDGHVKVWNIEGPAEILSFACTPGPFAAAVNPAGTLVATSNKDGAIKLCRLEPTYEWQTLDLATALPSAGRGWFQNVAFSPDGSILYTILATQASGTPNPYGRLQAWDTTTTGLFQLGHEVFLVEDLTNGPSALAVSPEGGWLAVGSYGGPVGLVKLFDAKTGAELAVLRGDKEEHRRIAIHPDESLVAAAGTAGTARVWDPATGEELYALAACSERFLAPAITYSPEGQLLVTVCFDGTVVGWEAATGMERFRLTETSNYGVAISPDGRYMATTGGDAIVRLWDMNTDDGIPQEIQQMIGHTSLALSPVFSPDGTRLATGSTDHTVRVWDVMTGAEMLALRAHTDGIWGVAFSPDGKRLASASRDGTARVFLLDLDEVMALAYSRLTRWFTEAECRALLHMDTCPPPPEELGNG
jgi:WD40 repeat protein/DNA-binding SARP family transcriptional activator